jgi:hypothetical protein
MFPDENRQLCCCVSMCRQRQAWFSVEEQTARIASIPNEPQLVIGSLHDAPAVARNR